MGALALNQDFRFGHPDACRIAARAPPVQRFSAFWTTSDLVPALLSRSLGVPHRVTAPFVLGAAQFGNTSPTLPL